MKVIEWILNVRGTDIWPGEQGQHHNTWQYAFITHCCIEGELWEINALCNTFSDGDTLKLYLDPLKMKNNRRRNPELGEDYG